MSISNLLSKLRGKSSDLLCRYPVLFCAGLLLLGGQIGKTIASQVSKPAEFFRDDASLWVLLACFGFFTTAGCLWWLQHRFQPSTSRRIVLGLKTGLATAVAGAILCAGIAVSFIGIPVQDDSLSPFAERQKQPIAVRAIVRSAAVWQPNPHFREQDPESRPWRTTWEVDCESILSNTEWQSIHSRSSLTVEGKVDDFLPGDHIEIYGAVRAIYPATNPGAFDMAKHQRQHDRLVSLSASNVNQIELLKSSWSRPLQRLRGMAVRSIDRNLHRYVTFDQGPLAAALVFGQRQQVDWEDQQQLMATGTLHMLAISGMHVEIVAAGALLLCWMLRFSERTRFVVLLCVCALYAGLAAGKPPVLRAAVLVMGFEVARQAGKKARLTNLLSLSAIVLFLIHASHIRNVGVHLSYLAVAAIGVFVTSVMDSRDRKSQPLDRLLREKLGTVARVSEMVWNWLMGMFRLSFWVWLITCPLVWFHFNIVAPVAIPLNVAVSIPLGFSLLSGLVTGLFGNVPMIGASAGWCCGQSLNAIQWMVHHGESVPLGHHWLPAPPLVWIIGFYGLVALWLLVFGTKRRTELGLSLIFLLVLGVAIVGSGPAGFLQLKSNTAVLEDNAAAHPFAVNFLDVGHGTCVVIELPDGRIWVYDAGHMGASDRSHQEIASMLWNRGVSRIDRLWISHADADHYNAVRGLAERFSIGSIATTQRFLSSDAPGVTRLLRYLHEKKISVVERHSGDSGTETNLRWEVLHPHSESLSESDNADSLCLLLHYDGRRILLPGDLDGTGMLHLLQLPERPCHVLMAPHHGSLTRDPALLLEWCQPELVVISGNHRAARPEVLAKYQPATHQLGITFRDGAIRCEISAGRPLQVSRWNKDKWEVFEDRNHSRPMTTRAVATLPDGF